MNPGSQRRRRKSMQSCSNIVKSSAFWQYVDSSHKLFMLSVMLLAAVSAVVWRLNLRGRPVSCARRLR